VSTAVELTLWSSVGRVHVVAARHGEAWRIELKDDWGDAVSPALLVGTEYETIVERLDKAYEALSGGPAVDPPGLRPLGQELGS